MSNPNQVGGASPHQQGIPCPECKSFIPMSIMQLLTEQVFKCPNCGLTIYLDKDQSKESMEALSKLDKAIKDVESVKKSVKK